MSEFIARKQPLEQVFTPLEEKKQPRKGLRLLKAFRCHNIFRRETMTYTNELLDELNILLQFNLETTQEGIKIHQSAGAQAIDATIRLHNKGLISQIDGGYLTDLGHIAAEHAQATHTILTPAHESPLKPAAM